MKVPVRSSRNRVASRLLLGGLIALSVILVSRARLGGFNPDTGRMAVITEYYGVSAEEIESIITIPMEEALTEITGIIEMKGISEFSRSRIDLRLAPSADLRHISMELREKVDRVYTAVKRRSPAVQKPQVVHSSQDQRPVFSVSFSGNGHSPESLRPFIEKEVKTSYARIQGLGEIMVLGGGPEEIHVEVDPEKAAFHSFSVLRIASVVRGANTYRVLGRLHEGSLSLPISFEGRLKYLENLRELPLEEGITLKSLAKVSFAHRRPEAISRMETRECVTLHIKTSSDSLISLSRALREQTRYWETEGLEAEVILDLGRELERSFLRVALALLTGMVLSGVLLALLTGEKKRVILLTTGQPILLLTSLAVISGTGSGLDTYVLAGLAVGIGMVLDAGLLITEALSLEDSSGLRTLTGALLSSTASSILALLPLFLLDREVPGLSSLALALTVLLSLSLVLSFLFIPPFYRPPPSRGSPSESERDILSVLRKKALLAATWFLRKRVQFHFFSLQPSALTAGALLFSGVLCLICLPKDLGLLMESPVVYAHLEMEEGMKVESVDARMTPLATRISAHPAVRQVQSTSRRSSGELSIAFDSHRISRENLLAFLREAGRDIPGGFLYLPEGRGKKSLSLEIALTGPDVKTLKAAARRALAELLEQPWALEGVLHFKDDPPAFLFVPDGAALAASGLSAADTAEFLRWNLQGPVADKWQRPEGETDLRVMATGAERFLREDLKALRITGPGETCRLDQLGVFLEDVESSRINRLNRQRSAGFTITGEKMDPYKLQALVWEVLDRIPLPAGYAFQPSSRLIEKTLFFHRLRAFFGFTVLLIFLLLAVERESIREALIILLPLPLVLVFPVLSMTILGKGLGSETLLGLILLAGLGINNGILLFDYLPKNRKIGPMEVLSALEKRFNGIFLTTTTTVAGLIPLLFADDTFFVNLAMVLISGLAGSFFIGLFVFPLLLTLPALLSQRPV